MKNIVTIDFDIVMGPSIDLYNDRVPITAWNELQSPYYQILKIDSFHYHNLFTYLLRMSKILNKNQICFIHSHEHLIQAIPQDWTDLHIINIDHHHDIKYNDKPDEPVSCANWASVLQNSGQCTSYTWICNSNSAFPPPELQEKYLTNHYIFNNFNLEALDTPDLLVLCLSEPWVPPEYYQLFFCWFDMFNEVYQTKFDFID